MKSVSGIGPKLAVNILSGMGPDDLLHAMARGDAPRLQSIPGVGKKTAERIALELKDKALEITGERPAPSTLLPAGEHQEMTDDAISALSNLGYPAKSARKAVDAALSTVGEVNLENLIKEALRRLA